MKAVPSTSTSTSTPAVLAALDVPERRDFAFSADGRHVAWIPDGTGTLVLDGTAIPTGLALPPGTTVEIISGDLLGVCQPADAGVDLAVLARQPGTEHFRTRRIATLGAPVSRLQPRAAGSQQFLAVGGVEGASALWRIDWEAGDVAFVLRVDGTAGAGVWVEPDRVLALNLIDAGGRGAVHLVDLAAGTSDQAFSVTSATDDRVCAYDPVRRRFVFTTDAPGEPHLTTAVLGDPMSVRLVGPVTALGAPWAVSAGGQVVTRTLRGACSGLRLFDLDDGVGHDLGLPDGEVSQPITTVAGGTVARCVFASPDLGSAVASFDLGAASGSFGAATLDHVEAPPLPTNVRRAWFSGAREGPGPDTAGHPEGHVAPPASAPGGRAIDMEAVVYEPPGAPELVVVALHGGPFDRWAYEWNSDFALMAGLGARVVALNYPGSTGYGEGFRRCVAGRGGELDVDGVVAVVDAVEAAVEAAAEGQGRPPIVLYGESYGAFLALAAATRRRVAGVVAFAGFGSYESLFGTAGDDVRRTLELLSSGNLGARGRNPLKRCRIILGKVLFAHGTNDRTIPIGEARKAAGALRARGGSGGETKVRFIEFEGQGHGLSGRPALRRWRRELAAFIADERNPRLSSGRSEATGVTFAGRSNENTNEGG